MITRDKAKLFGLDKQVTLESFDEAVDMFEWYTGMPANMGRIEPVYRYAGIPNPENFFMYMVWMDSQSPGCLSVNQ